MAGDARKLGEMDEQAIPEGQLQQTWFLVRITSTAVLDAGSCYRCFDVECSVWVCVLIMTVTHTTILQLSGLCPGQPV